MPKAKEVAALEGVVDPTKLDLLDPNNICGHRTKSGSICRRHAGWGTNHYGRGPCVAHGGGKGHAPLLNRREYLLAKLDPRLAERVESLLEDTDLLNCRTELAILKAHFDELAADPEAKMNTLMSLASTITKNAKIIHEMEFGKQHFIHVSVAGAIVQAFADIGRQYVTDPLAQGQFEADVVRALRAAMRDLRAPAVAAALIGPHISDDVERLDGDE